MAHNDGLETLLVPDREAEPSRPLPPERRVDRVRRRFNRTAFEALYGRFAWAYDWVSHTFFLGQWHVWQRAALRFVSGRRVLEVGMGTGDLQADLLRAGYEAWGIDLSPQMSRRAARKSKKLGLRLNMCRARSQALPFPAASFDTVVSTFPSDYIVDQESTREIGRVLRPGGRLVIVPGGWLRPADLRGRAFSGVARAVYGYKGDDDPVQIARQLQQSPGWYRWTVALREGLRRAGFSLSAHILSNQRGACLIIVATLQVRRADSPRVLC